MARTPRASKASDATRSGKTRPAKKTAGKQTQAPQARAATPKGSKKKAAAAPPAPRSAKKKAATAGPSASTKGAKQRAGTKQAAPSKKAAKKPASEQAPAPKKAAKKPASEQAPAPKKAAKKPASEQAPAPKKAAKKKPVDAPVSEQLALDIGTPAEAAPAPARPLQPGDRVPDFSLEADDGQTYSRQSLAGERFVIYFYPKDDTPGCTREACDFRDNRPRFDAASVKVLGVSGDSLASHGRFRSKYELDFPLLADPDRRVAQAFGAVGEKKLYGKTRVGIIRSTFVVGPDGVVEKTFSPVKVDGHAQAVLQAIGSA